MKGIVFNIFTKFIEEVHGLEEWDDLLLKSNLEGIYTAAGTYPDEQLLSLVSCYVEKHQVEVGPVLKQFGHFTLKEFQKRYANLFTESDFKSFIFSIESVIHKEVKKLYPEAVLPTFKYCDISDDTFTMQYMSARKLCPFAIGLIEEAANLYRVSINIKHEVCQNHGSDHCLFEIQYHK